MEEPRQSVIGRHLGRHWVCQFNQPVSAPRSEAAINARLDADLSPQFTPCLRCDARKEYLEETTVNYAARIALQSKATGYLVNGVYFSEYKMSNARHIYASWVVPPWQPIATAQ